MDENRFIAALEKISDRLDAVVSAIKAHEAPRSALGFGESPRATIIYCNRTQGGVWYRLEYPASGGDPVPVDIPQRCLTARLKGFTFPKKEHKNKEQLKMCLHVEADRQYVLETGHDTVLAKSIYADIASMSVEDLMQPVTIELRPAESDTVIFSKIYAAGGKPVNSEALRDADLRTVVQTAVDKLKQANEHKEG